jgi:hypothetical protein
MCRSRGIPGQATRSWRALRWRAKPQRGKLLTNQLSQLDDDFAVGPDRSAPSADRFRALRPGFATWFRIGLVVAIVAALFGLLFLVVTNTSPAAGNALPGVISITEAQFCHPSGTSDAIPSACTWKNVHLPNYFNKPRTDASQSALDLDDGWFRASFQSAGDHAAGLGLYVHELDRAGRIWVNGRLFQPVENLNGRLPLNWNRGKFFVIPPSMLVDGTNEIQIQVRTYRTGGTLGTMKVGPPDVLHDYWRRVAFYRNELVEILGVTTATIGVFMLAVWLGRRSEQAYLWFGLTCLTWSAISFDFYGRFPPLPPEIWDHTVICCHVLVTVFICTFVLRYCGRTSSKVEASMWLYFFAGASLFFTHVVGYGFVFLWLTGTWIWSTYFCYAVIFEGWRRSWWEGTLIAFAAVSQHVAAGYDLWLYTHLDFSSNVFIAHYFEPLYLLVVGLTLIRAFIDSLNSYQRLTDKLENIVEDKTRELAAQYRRTADLERDKVLSEERGRIMSEMHDGIGSQLTIALSLARTGLPTPGKGELATVLMESIQDLQLIINSLEPMEHDLLTVLGTLRYQMEDRVPPASVLDDHGNRPVTDR